MLMTLLLLGQASGAAAQPQILIDRQPPTAERIFFDPRNPPANMPKLHPGEAALCQFNFNCSVKLKYEVMDQRTSSETASVSVHVRQVHVTLTLHNRIYLPRGANAKIRAHEEGHRIINERVYENAERIARSAALEVLTQTWQGSGDTPDSAAKTATDLAVTKLCETYLAGTAGKASRIGDIYDELTRHGRNTRLAEAEAIRQSFARFDSEQSSKPDPTGAPE